MELGDGFGVCLLLLRNDLCSETLVSTVLSVLELKIFFKSSRRQKILNIPNESDQLTSNPRLNLNVFFDFSKFLNLKL